MEPQSETDAMTAAMDGITEGASVGIDPSSRGAPPAAEEVALEGGRPMAVAELSGRPRVPRPHRRWTSLRATSLKGSSCALPWAQPPCPSRSPLPM
eukprot:8322447-Pyramimonas_sp.AAC.1